MEPGSPAPFIISGPSQEGASFVGVQNMPKIRGPMSKRFVILIITLLVLIVAAVAITLIVTKQQNLTSQANLQAIFDQSAPVPVGFEGDKYGYVSPSNGKLVLEANFTYAERFYGEYAKVAVPSQRGDRYQVINRSGKIVASADDGETEGVEYIVDQNIWKVGVAFYDGKMSRLTSEKDEAEYLGYGFISVKPKEGQGYPRILNNRGKEVFACKIMDCSVIIGSDFNENGDFYAIVQYDDRVSSLISLKNGKEVISISSESSEYFVSDGNNLFSVRRAGDGAVQKRFFAYQGKVAREFDSKDSLMPLASQDIILVNTPDKGIKYYNINDDSLYDLMKEEWSNFKEYPSASHAVAYCEDSGKYKLTKELNDTSSCRYDRIVTLPKNTYEYYSKHKKQDLFVLFADNVSLFDARSGKTKKELSQQTAISTVQFFENSIFYIVDGETIYSLERLDGDGLDISGYSSIDCFGNFFVLNGTTIYGPEFKIINDEGAK